MLIVLINAITVIVGGVVGSFLKKGIPDVLKQAIMSPSVCMLFILASPDCRQRFSLSYSCFRSFWERSAERRSIATSPQVPYPSLPHTVRKLAHSTAAPYQIKASALI